MSYDLGTESERAVHIEIGGVDDITMSWSYGVDDPGPALVEVQRYLPVFDRHGYVAFDPQLERLFDSEDAAGDAADIHRDVRRRLTDEYGNELVPRRSWWKRLLGSG